MIIGVMGGGEDEKLTGDGFVMKTKKIKSVIQFKAIQY
jgi:hypothetical protein